jgi:hypothetical protein
MSTVPEIEKAIQQLSSEELAKFREWFAEFDAAVWDQQIEQDARSGKLDALASDAISDLKAGHCKNL